MYKLIENCLCCNSKELTFALDLNSQPLANSYLKNKNDVEEIFPLGINYCSNCSHLQLTHAVDPDQLFKYYIYVSGTTKTLRDYFDWFANFSKTYTTGKTVLDIACNDGSQLDSYKSLGFNTYGIDPATNLFELSSKNHKIICDYFNVKNVNKFDTKFDIITAQNVFAHNTYPKDFLIDCKTILADNGCIFIQTSQADMIKNNQFDTIYHEHISFFSVKSFCTLANRCGLNVIDVRRTSIHGTSFIFALSKDLPDQSAKFISLEENLTSDIIKKYAENCNRIAKETFNEVLKLKQQGYKLIGYGAAAKGNTFLNFSKFNLDYIVDDNPLKHNLFSPGSKIPIYSPDKLSEESEKICIVPLAWNFFDEIKEKVLLKNNNVIFLKYFPGVQIIQ